MNLDNSNGFVLDMSEKTARAAPVVATVGGGAPSAVRHRLKGNSVLSGAIWILDATTVIVATIIVTFACHVAGPGQRHTLEVAELVAVLMFCLLSKNDGSNVDRPLGPLSEQLVRFLHLTPSLVFSAAAGAAAFALLGWGWPQLFPAITLWFVVNIVALATVRGIGLYALTHPTVTERMARKVAVIGSDGHASRVATLCQSYPDDAIRFLGVFSDDASSSGGTSVQGSVEDLIELSRETLLDDIIIALPPDGDAADTVARLRWRLRGVAAEVYIMPYLTQAEDVLPVETFGPLSLMVVQRRPLTHGQAIRKRLLDLTLGMVLLILLLPVIAVVALAVKLDSPGPVLFRQPRLGFNDRPFTVLKFRSMYANASDLMAMQQTSRSDPRVTRIGKWLRKLSLDELPQLFNVLAGDMSLVGPRPHAPQTRAGGRLLKDVMAEYVIRHQVKPGITGWAQINGSRGELVTTEDLRRRVNYDLEYIQKWSVWFDIRIIVTTVLREVFSKHAF